MVVCKFNDLIMSSKNCEEPSWEIVLKWLDFFVFLFFNGIDDVLFLFRRRSDKNRLDLPEQVAQVCRLQKLAVF